MKLIEKIFLGLIIIILTVEIFDTDDVMFHVMPFLMVFIFYSNINSKSNENIR